MHNPKDHYQQQQPQPQYGTPFPFGTPHELGIPYQGYPQPQTPFPNISEALTLSVLWFYAGTNHIAPMMNEMLEQYVVMYIRLRVPVIRPFIHEPTPSFTEEQILELRDKICKMIKSRIIPGIAEYQEQSNATLNELITGVGVQRTILSYIDEVITNTSNRLW